MKKAKRSLSLVLALLVLMSMAACTAPVGGSYDVPALMQSILRQVRFDAELISIKDAWMSFNDLPSTAQVVMYQAKGQIADEVVLITLESKKDMTVAEENLQQYIGNRKGQFQNYAPAEATKYDKAIIWKHENHLLLCVTADHASVSLILNHASDPNYQLSGREDPPASSSDSQIDPPGSSSSESSSSASSSSSESNGNSSGTGDNKPSVRPDGYPAINSQSGKYHAYAGTSMIRVDNQAFEICGYNDTATGNYASLVSKVADALKGKTKVYSLPIPTAFGVMLPDDIRASYPDYKDQGQSIEKLFAKMSSNVIPVRTYHNLMSHRDEYLYFRTDHHWNGIGAYYAYESFCETKGFTPYTMAQRKEKQVGNFLGSLYINSKRDQNLLPADTIYAYYPYSESATMTYYEKDGTGKNWSIISGNSGYTLFAAGDKPLAVFTNPEVTDGSVCIVIKESYGNALMPYLVDHYSTIYEIDYRHWTGDDLVEYAKSVNANDLIFANNVMMINTPSLITTLGTIIK